MGNGQGDLKKVVGRPPWSVQNENLQPDAGKRCATRRSPRSALNENREVMRSTDAPLPVSSAKVSELLRGQAGLAKDRPQRPESELVVHRNDDRAPVLVAQLHVASSLTHLLESSPCQCPDRLRSGDDGQTGSHAESSTVAIMGGSNFSGDAPSK